MNVVRLIPLQRPYADALAAFLQGRHVRCLSLLHGHDSLEASLLRARAFLRMRRFDEAHAELTQPTLPLGDHARCAEFQFLLGTTLARIGKFHEANEALAVADAYATSSCDGNLVTEVASYCAFTAFLCGNYDEVQEIASEALSERNGSAHARLLEMLGFVAALRGDSESQLMMLLAANEHLRQLQSRDTYLEANMLNNLAVAVIEADPSGLAAYIRARASEIEWHDELGLLHFHVTHHLGWLDALGGDELSAFRHFRTAIDVAPTAARRAEALVSRGLLARAMEESINAAECLADADEQIVGVDWNATTDDERIVLIEFATLVSSSDPERAAHLVDRYKAIHSSINRFDLAGHGDPLHRGKELHAFGIVARDLGRASAIPSLHEAYQLFRSVSSNWRAALVALDLFECVGDPSMLAFAQREAARLPHSWFAQRCFRASRASISR